MQTKHHQNTAPILGGLGANIPAGLVDKNAEFFVSHDGSLMGVHNGSVVSLGKIPYKVIFELSQYFDKENEAIELLYTHFKCKDYKQTFIKWFTCNFGGFDKQPDYSVGKEPVREYWNCGKRNNCVCEGIVCKPACIVKHSLTRTEAEVIKWIAEGKIAKEIAAKMNITESTAHTHERNIHKKLGANNRAEISMFAYKNNITF